MRQQADGVALANKLVTVAQFLKSDGFVRQSARRVFGNYENYRRQTTPEQRQWVQQVKKGVSPCTVESVPVSYEREVREIRGVRMEITMPEGRHARFKRLCQQLKRDMNRHINHLIAEELQRHEQ